MPLIVFTGHPSSGKTTVAKKLQAALQSKIDSLKGTTELGHNYSVIYHSDKTLGIPHETYFDSGLEKHARGSQMAAVKRDISRTNFVILDSLTYIKGFRYQLFCEAKGVLTPNCVVYVMNPVDKCLEWDAAKTPESAQWGSKIIEQLAMRYEEPNESNRWDSPLFSVVADHAEDSLSIDAIWEALVLKKAPPPNAATIVKTTSGNNFLQELDNQTQQVIQKILQHQQLAPIGGQVLVSDSKSKNSSNVLYVEMPSSSVSIAQLQRIRRTYVTLNRMRSVDVERITPLFVDYLNRSLNNE
ncbi:protein Kti12p [[Candida] railenensis]|uniref:Protein Kti12p n=1 Tax=[Candida] railenensis TaxID=45579 RepID=A0A9P0QN86_9ASCO|nr:protein Kti12p [[Candida] railenensis]